MLRGITRADKVLALILLAAAAGFWLFSALGGSALAAETAVVERAGQEVLRVPLTRPGLYEVPLPEGHAVIEVAEGRVRMLPMPRSICPKGICSATGWISSPAQLIACVPNLLVVRLTGSSDLDALVG